MRSLIDEDVIKLKTLISLIDTFIRHKRIGQSNNNKKRSDNIQH